VNSRHHLARRAAQPANELPRGPVQSPARVLLAHREAQDRAWLLAGKKWIEMGLVFTTRIGTPLDAADVRRDFRVAIRRVPGIDADAWTPRELRHSFVSLLSDGGVPLKRSPGSWDTRARW
jgi:integrase